MPKATKKQRTSAIIYGVLFLVLVIGGLVAGLVLSKRNQDVGSKASTRTGIAKVAYQTANPTAVVNKEQRVDVTINTAGALIDGVQLGIRFRSPNVNSDVRFVPAPNLPLKVARELPNKTTPEPGLDVILLAAGDKPVSLPGTVTLGTVVYTPTKVGPLEIAFDPTVSKVTTRRGVSSSPRPSDLPLDDSGPGGPLQTHEAQVGVASSMPSVSDILQTPSSITMNVVANTVASPTPLPTSPPIPGDNNYVSWRTPYAFLKADAFYIEANGKRFTSTGAQVTVHSDGYDTGDPNYTTLEMTWQEQDTEMRLFIYFRSEGNRWRATEIRTYDGKTPGNWLYYDGLSYVNMGESYQTGDFLYRSKDRAGTLYMRNVTINAFGSRTAPVTCMSDAQCPAGQECYQPPMPSCPPGQACPQVLPIRTCRPMLRGDFNKDRAVNVLDLSVLVRNLLTKTTAGDLNNDGFVDLFDYSIMLTLLR